MEERTFKLLNALAAAPQASGPLSNDMLAAATPPAHKPRASAAWADPSRLVRISDVPPLDDQDLQPVPGSRLPDSHFRAPGPHAHAAAAPPPKPPPQQERRVHYAAPSAHACGSSEAALRAEADFLEPAKKKARLDDKD